MGARFGDFEVDLQAGQLRKRGLRIKLQDQPFLVLAALLEKPGEVVTREELQQRIWPDGTYVDFDQSLNKAVNKLRDALADSADRPRYIETLPRRGYRFIGAIERSDQSSTHPSQDGSRGGKQYLPRRVVLLGAFGILVAGFVVAWFDLRGPAKRDELKLRKLTTNFAERPVFGGVISPDGKHLAWSDEIGIHITLIATGEARVIARPKALAVEDAWIPVAWFPDATRIVANSETLAPRGQRAGIWIIPVLGGLASQLRDDGLAGAISPDGTLIAFLSGGNHLDREIWVMGARGEDARRVVTAQGIDSLSHLHWSPDGRRIGYGRMIQARDRGEYVIESRGLKGGTNTVILPGLPDDPIDFCWLPNGRVIYPALGQPLDRDANLWQIRVDEKTGLPTGNRHRITNLAGFSFESFSSSTDGKKLAFQNNSYQNDVYVARRKTSGTGIEAPRRLTLDERTGVPNAWTPDSRAVIFISNRNESVGIFKQALDEDGAEPVVTGPENAIVPRLSPDGSSIIYVAAPMGAINGRVMRVPIAGGVPKFVMETKGFFTIHCTRHPSTMCLISEPSADVKVEVITAFDLVRGRGRELLRLPLNTGAIYSVAPAPDGSRMAILKPNERRLQIVSITGKPEGEVDLSGWSGLGSLDWDSDGKAVFIASNFRLGASLLRVELDGNVQLLWTQKGNRQGTWGIPSPDGQYLAMKGSTSDGNFWMLENF